MDFTPLFYITSPNKAGALCANMCSFMREEDINAAGILYGSAFHYVL